MSLPHPSWYLLPLLASALPAQVQWFVNPANDHNYALLDNVSWQQAEDIAVSMGGNLVTIRSQAENDWLNSTFSSLAGTAMWIGLNDATEEGTYVWSSGEPVSFTNWDVAQPSDPTGSNDFVIMFRSIGFWDDLTERTRPAIIEVFDRPVAEILGTGCANGAGVPGFAPASGSVPLLGKDFNLEFSSLPATQFVKLFGLVGFSKTSWAGFTLPQDLAFINAPGCTQYVSIDASFQLPHTGGTATWDISIPNDRSLSGLEFFLQALVIDVLGPVRFSVTNAIGAAIGVL